MDHAKIYPRIGVGVIVTNGEGRVLMGKRRNAHGQGTWALSGGNLEFGESLLECARRELFEETGLQGEQGKILGFVENVFEEENLHYVTFFVQFEKAKGKIACKELDKCEKWEWFDFENLPEPLFLPFRDFLKQYFVDL